MLNEMDMRNLIVKSLKHVCPEIDEKDLTDEKDLREQFDIDSVDMIRYVSKLEETLAISFGGQNFSDFYTLGGSLKRMKMALVSQD